MAVETLMGYYPSIQASDQKIYVTGLIQLFAQYPEYLRAEAIDPVNGLPSLCDFPPTLKQAKDFLEPRMQNHWRQTQQFERRKQQLLPEPPRDPEMVARVNAGFAELVESLKMANAVHRPSPFPAEPIVRDEASIPKLTERAKAVVAEQKR